MTYDLNTVVGAGVEAILEQQRDMQLDLIIDQLTTLNTNQENLMADFARLDNAIRNEIASVIADYRTRTEAALSQAQTAEDALAAFNAEADALTSAIEAEGVYGQDATEAPAEPAPVEGEQPAPVEGDTTPAPSPDSGIEAPAPVDETAPVESGASPSTPTTDNPEGIPTEYPGEPQA